MSSTQLSDLAPPEILSLLPTDDPVSASLLQHAHSSLPPAIFNHSLRVHLLTSWLARHESSPLAASPLIFLASIGHDLGASAAHNGPQRFEVEGADATCAHIRSAKAPSPPDAASSAGQAGTLSDDALHQIWTAIALHTSPGIAERIDPLTRLVRLGVKMDFSPETAAHYGASDYAAQIEQWLPRHGIERVLGDAVVGQAEQHCGEMLRRPEVVEKGKLVDAQGRWLDCEKFPMASWSGTLLRASVEARAEEGEGGDGVNKAF